MQVTYDQDDIRFVERALQVLRIDRLQLRAWGAHSSALTMQIEVGEALLERMHEQAARQELAS